MNQKNILLGITGGIAAYKTPEIVRLLRRKGHSVRIVMTEAAEKLVSRYTLQTLSENRVYSEMFADSDFDIDHISLARWADIMLIAPATACTLAKISCGIADNLLTSTVLSLKIPLAVCPAMNTAMWENQATVENIRKLRERGVYLIGPESGELACGESGSGRMSSPEKICDLLEMLISPSILSGLKITVTAGPTREAMDSVRCITNHSSGKMGYALAQAARNLKAEVTLISGPVSLPDPPGIRTVRVDTALQMKNAMEDTPADILIMCAAVCDFSIETFHGKLSKSDFPSSLKLMKNPDLVSDYKKKFPMVKTIGFAAEYGMNSEKALSKLREKNLDFIVLNDISRTDLGFGSDRNQVTIFSKTGQTFQCPEISKYETAEQILSFTCTMEHSCSQM